jgi:hypothetical protein
MIWPGCKDFGFVQRSVMAKSLKQDEKDADRLSARVRKARELLQQLDVKAKEIQAQSKRKKNR